MQSEQTVVNNPRKRQFEIQLGQEMALLAYRERPGQIELMHTEVPISQRGKGIGERIVKFALEYARQNQLQVIPSCRFVQAYLKRHPEAV
jgi:predicted GNAT family acetyltransferase